MSKKREEDTYIRILKYAEENPDGFLFQKMIEDLKLTATEIQILQREKSEGKILIEFRRVTDAESYRGDHGLLSLRFEDKSRLIQYSEINSIRRRYSVTFTVAIISLMLPVCIFLYEIWNPSTVKIDQYQIDELVNFFDKNFSPELKMDRPDTVVTQSSVFPLA
ncbi:MAG: hypothetical protein AAB373_06675 [Patescibacteria group bacterium]